MRLVAIYTTWDQVDPDEFAPTKHAAEIGEGETVAALYARLWPKNNKAEWGNSVEIHPVVDAPEEPTHE